MDAAARVEPRSDVDNLPDDEDFWSLRQISDTWSFLTILHLTIIQIITSITDLL